MFRSWRGVAARFRALVHTEAAGLRQGFLALLVSSGGDLLAGLTLAGITGTLERLPGLMVLVPGAIGMRGAIFGALGSRLGTAIHMGTFRPSRRLDSTVGQNLAAALLLSLVSSIVLAVLAKVVAVAFGVEDLISITDFLVISVVGALLASAFVAGITLAVAGLSVRRGWDLDNVAAPIVTAAGDVVTLPGLWVATSLVGLRWVTPSVGVACVVAGVLSLVYTLRSRAPILKRIVLESLPVLVLAGAISVIAGVAVQARLGDLLEYKALLIMLPPFLEDAGALGGILASRLSTRLHLGLIEPSLLPGRAVAADIMLVFVFAIPVFVLVGVASDVVATLGNHSSPGAFEMVQVALLGGILATSAAVLVAFYGAAGTYRFGLDPDNHGTAIVTSAVDLLGAFAFILALAVLGLI